MKCHLLLSVIRTTSFGALGIVISALAICCGTRNATAADSLPWPKVEQTVRAHFEALPGYRSGDLISRDQVKAVLVKLAAEGWTVPQGDELLARVPADGSWLVRTLRTHQGTRFMRQISRMPQGYDRVDRLSRLADGRQLVNALIRGPGGEKMIQYLLTPYGQNMGRQLSNGPGGANFNEPTGMIYTVDSLLVQLSELYQSPSGQPTAQRRYP